MSDPYGDFGSIGIGRLRLREALSAASETNGSTGARQLKLTGQEAVPVLTSAHLAAIQDDLPGLVGSFVPVTFTQKTDRNGYWIVSDCQADLMNWNGELVTCTWQLTLNRAGSDTEVDLESRLTGALARVNAYGVTEAERIHVPPIGHYAYYTGSTQPSVLIRQGSDGAMQVYRGIPATINPRYGCPVSAYLLGRSRFLDANGIERDGISFSVRAQNPPTEPSDTLAPSSSLLPESGTVGNWTLHNTLVKVNPVTGGSAGMLNISAYTDGGWHTKTWDITVNGASVGTPDSVTVLRNEPEIVVVRLLRAGNPGRTTVDLTLRRGHRAVEIYVQAAFSSTLAVKLVTAEAGSNAHPGYVVGTSDDADGNRYVVGSASAFTADTVQGGISASSVIAFDAFVGVQAGGLDALDGDQADDLFNHYLSAAAESVGAVLR